MTQKELMKLMLGGYTSLEKSKEGKILKLIRNEGGEIKTYLADKPKSKEK